MSIITIIIIIITIIRRSRGRRDLGSKTDRRPEVIPILNLARDAAHKFAMMYSDACSKEEKRQLEQAAKAETEPIVIQLFTVPYDFRVVGINRGYSLSLLNQCCCLLHCSPSWADLEDICPVGRYSSAMLHHHRSDTWTGGVVHGTGRWLRPSKSIGTSIVLLSVLSVLP